LKGCATYPVNEDKATRYHRTRRRLSVFGTVAGAILLMAFVASGGSAWLRTHAESWAGGSFALTVASYVIALTLGAELLQLPLAIYAGLILERRYGLSTETTARWWLDFAKAAAIGIVFAVAGALAVSSLLLWVPDRWWIAAAVVFSVVLIALVQLAPVLLLPIFYNFKPLDRPALRDRLVALANRAGARVLGVFEWKLGDRTRKANAALTGIGRTRRIIVSDTLLADHSDDEIEVILAHELAHHVHRDIWKGIALEVLLIAAGFFLADRALTAVVGQFGIVSKSDAAALPILLLAGGAVSLAFTPVVNALSRAHERRADRYALEMTRNAAAFTSAMKRLGALNLAEDRPSRLVEFLFYTHPPITARIEAARRWAARDQR
jgi:STE24 endopeptidase